MANMSYCRFENTYADLQDCYAHMDEHTLSPTEQRYRNLVIRLALGIAEDYGDEIRDNED
jgi:hypothetical protein